MARNWKSRQAPPPTSITEIARRYHGAAVALAQTLGLSLQEVLTAHRESVTAIFIECGRCDLRLPAAVKLPPLVPPTDPETGAIECTGMPPAPEAPTNGHPAWPRQDHPPADPSTNGSVPEHGTGVPSPTTSPTAGGLPTSIPAGLQLPCAEALISDLRPPQLSLLIGKVGLRALADKSLEPLHVALLAERARRFEQGRKPTPSRP
jgi:hypothetical protein